MATNNATNNYSLQNNLIIGGNFDTNPWQSGTSFVSPASSSYLADMFLWTFTGTGVINAQRTASAPSAADAGIFTQNCLQTIVTTADTTISATDVYTIQYRMEGYDWAQIAQQPFVLSFWVMSSVTGTFSVSFRDNSPISMSFVQGYTINNANTWEKKVILVSPSPATGSWNYTNGVGLVIDFTLAAGSSFVITPGSWVASNRVAVSGQVNAMDAVNNTFAIQLVKIDRGFTVTPWPYRAVSEELALAQRYFYKTFPQGVTPEQNSGSLLSPLNYKIPASLGSTLGVGMMFPVTMRTTPTMIAYNPQNTNTNWRNVSAGADSGASAFIQAGPGGVYVSCNQGLLEAVGNTLCIHLTASARL